MLAADPAADSDELIRALENSRDDPRARDLFALADDFNALCSLGDREREMCLKVLKAFGEYQARGMRLNRDD
jgi:hypothetical protein